MNFPSSITNDTILRGCYELTDLDCIDSYLQYINVDEDKNCYAQCPLECTEILIDLKPSYSNYPTEWYSSVLLNHSAFIAMVAKTATANFTPDISFLRANTLLLNVYYDQMSYDYRHADRCFWRQHGCVSYFKFHLEFNILYLAGLFLGITVLSFVELIEIIFYMSYFNITSKRLLKKWCKIKYY